MSDKEFKRFEKYEQFQKKDKQASKKAKAVRHPIKLSHFKAHEYKEYALKKPNREAIEYGPKMSSQQGWHLMGQLIHNWTPFQKTLAVIAILLFGITIINSFFAV